MKHKPIVNRVKQWITITLNKTAYTRIIQVLVNAGWEPGWGVTLEELQQRIQVFIPISKVELMLSYLVNTNEVYEIFPFRAKGKFYALDPASDFWTDYERNSL